MLRFSSIGRSALLSLRSRHRNNGIVQGTPSSSTRAFEKGRPGRGRIEIAFPLVMLVVLGSLEVDLPCFPQRIQRQSPSCPSPSHFRCRKKVLGESKYKCFGWPYKYRSIYQQRSQHFARLQQRQITYVLGVAWPCSLPQLVALWESVENVFSA